MRARQRVDEPGDRLRRAHRAGDARLGRRRDGQRARAARWRSCAALGRWRCSTAATHVTPDDIKRIALPALRHRIALAPDAPARGAHDQRSADRGDRNHRCAARLGHSSATSRDSGTNGSARARGKRCRRCVVALADGHAGDCRRQSGRCLPRSLLVAAALGTTLLLAAAPGARSSPAMTRRLPAALRDRRRGGRCSWRS